MLTDTHCHLYLEQFAGDIDDVIQRAIDAGIEKMLVPGMDLETSYEAVRLAETYSNIFAAVGFHPTDMQKFNTKSFDEICRLAEHPKVIAIGEIGLDYYWVKETEKRMEQRQNLLPHLELANKVNKPIILHLREENDAETGDATTDLFNILKPWCEKLDALKSRPGVFHSFNGNLESAKRAMGMNFFIGIAGPVTYRKNETQRELVRQLPLDRILIETDSPFQTPVPHRGKHNEPANVGLIADKIAEVHRTSREAVASITTANANRLFRWEAHP
ncbi:MAG TPA: TatD family hydrolase [Anaerolineales bacterium]|jgi:TatD DNase family protein|nr:TatD family hydrolase [Anaerolineales bacterium]HQX17558.1 TatD family hydrolase [Anaerolineales bacterium]